MKRSKCRTTAMPTTTILKFRRELTRLGVGQCVREQQGNDMSLSGFFARIVALIGAAALLWRRLQGAAPEPSWGSAPVVPVAKPQGSIPTLKMPTARGWTDGQTPVAASGLKVNAFATGLKPTRWIHVLPNGDVLVAEATQVQGPVRSAFGYAMQAPRRRAAALGESANRITLLRDSDGDGIAEAREIFME